MPEEKGKDDLNKRNQLGGNNNDRTDERKDKQQDFIG